MKPTTYAFIGAAAILVVLLAGILIGRAMNKGCPQPDPEAQAAWKSAAEGWMVVVKNREKENAALKQEVHILDSLLRIPVKTKVNDTYRRISGLPDDSLANLGLAAPVQYP